MRNGPGLVFAATIVLFPAMDAAVPAPFADRKRGLAQNYRHLGSAIPFLNVALTDQIREHGFDFAQFL